MKAHNLALKQQNYYLLRVTAEAPGQRLDLMVTYAFLWSNG